jgi:hypothetical protein
MAFATSAERTVLWDQFSYTGDPDDFSWVLPVLPGAYLEESTDAWFEALEAVTTTNVIAPSLPCLGGSASRGGFSCGGGDDSLESAGSDTSAGRGTVDGVTVVHQGTVGPYETVTLGSTDGDALRKWLDAHGYVVPDGIDPVIDAYVDEGHDFIALRLQPGKDVQQMTPVRVVTPGGPSQLPLRMVAAGIDDGVAITLFVIAEARHAMPDLPEMSVRWDDLGWNWLSSTSNYLTLRADALAENGGETYITSFALEQALSARVTRPDGIQARYSLAGESAFFGAYDNFADLYFAQAAANDGVSDLCGTPRDSMPFAEAGLVVENCRSDGVGPCDSLEAGRISSGDFECGGYTDIAAALIGMHPTSAWVTRLELELPRTALDMDCVVEPAASQKTVESWHVARRHVNPPCNPSPWSSSIRPAARGEGRTVGWALAGLGAAWLARRVLRRRA